MKNIQSHPHTNTYKFIFFAEEGEPGGGDNQETISTPNPKTDYSSDIPTKNEVIKKTSKSQEEETENAKNPFKNPNLSSEDIFRISMKNTIMTSSRMNYLMNFLDIDNTPELNIDFGHKPIDITSEENLPKINLSELFENMSAEELKKLKDMSTKWGFNRNMTLDEVIKTSNELFGDRKNNNLLYLGEDDFNKGSFNTEQSLPMNTLLKINPSIGINNNRDNFNEVYDWSDQEVKNVTDSLLQYQQEKNLLPEDKLNQFEKHTPREGLKYLKANSLLNTMIDWMTEDGVITQEKAEEMRSNEYVFSMLEDARRIAKQWYKKQTKEEGNK